MRQYVAWTHEDWQCQVGKPIGRGSNHNCVNSKPVKISAYNDWEHRSMRLLVNCIIGLTGCVDLSLSPISGCHHLTQQWICHKPQCVSIIPQHLTYLLRTNGTPHVHQHRLFVGVSSCDQLSSGKSMHQTTLWMLTTQWLWLIDQIKLFKDYYPSDRRK